MNEWIKCSDRLPDNPEKGCIVIIIASYCIERKIWHVSQAEFQKNNFYNLYNERMSIDDPYWAITHWMELPKPPKENE